MSKEQFRSNERAKGHTVEVAAKDHQDINGKPVRTVRYRSKDFKETEMPAELSLHVGKRKKK